MWTPISHKLHISMQAQLSRKRALAEAAEPSMDALGFLSSPRTAKLHERTVLLQGGELCAGHSSMQGWRLAMEDAFIATDLPLPGHSLLAIFDGHAGDRCSAFAAAQLQTVLEQTSEWQAYCRGGSTGGDVDLLRLALVRTCIELDSRFADQPDVVRGADISGSTAVVCLLTPVQIVCANLGDSRCVLRSAGQTINLSEDHKPEDAEEARRIYAAGGFVVDNRVNGELAMSRALGDFRYKDRPDLEHTQQKVLGVPDVAVRARSAADEVLLLACDGVFDVMTNAEAVDFLHKALVHDSLSPEAATGELVDLAFRLQSTDNISAIALSLRRTDDRKSTRSV